MDYPSPPMPLRATYGYIFTIRKRLAAERHHFAYEQAYGRYYYRQRDGWRGYLTLWGALEKEAFRTAYPKALPAIDRLSLSKRIRDLR